MTPTSPKVNSTPNTLSQGPSLSNQLNSYTRMSHRRAIACTICAKAKTKCDKLVPSCSRCTAKGLPCEPRSTRRTSDSNYRATAKKHMVSPKRFSSTSSIPNLSRHGSPRSVPNPNRRHLVRAISQIDMSSASKFQQQQNYPGMPLLAGLHAYTPQIIDEYYSDYSSPEPNLGIFAPQTTKSTFLNSRRLTPQTPESFVYNEPIAVADPFDQYTNPQAWSDDGLIPIGLGLENDMPGMLLTEPTMQMWSTPEVNIPTTTTTASTAQPFESPLCQSPASLNTWPEPSLSVSPTQLPHTRGVPSLSMSESSAQEYDSPDNQNGSQDKWNNFRMNSCQMAIPKLNPANFLDTIKVNSRHPQWEDVILTRSSTF